jgi:2-polyprenyl-6-hydroxyphenyl methylase/3-demethylubiquinone-9 3-methyltransferase
MIADYESAVASRFDTLRARFKRVLADDDPRLTSVLGALNPLDGRRVLDLGCGKGRFAKALRAHGARVVGLDVSGGMLAEADSGRLELLQGSARQLPLATASFDRVVAIEVFEHLDPRSLDVVCGEVRRVLRPGGIFVVVDKNVYSWNARRRWLPSVAVKWIDERRGRWMYSPGEPVRERWFVPRGLRRRLRRWFPEVRVVPILSRDEAGRFPFQQIPGTRLLMLWAARTPGEAA